MVLAVVIVLVVGLAFIFGSYIFSEKLEESDAADKLVKIPDELTKEQKKQIDKLVKDYMDEKVNGQLSDIEGKLSEIVNQKTLALGDYAVTVNEEIEKNHQEVMFLYNMLNDKQKEIMTTASMVDDVKKEVKDIVDNSKESAAAKPEPEKKNNNKKKKSDKKEENKQEKKDEVSEASEEEELREIDEELEKERSEENAPELVAEENGDASAEASKDLILEMHKSGLSILEIAKHLGMGVGEVKLVVDLYQGEKKA